MSPKTWCRSVSDHSVLWILRDDGQLYEDAAARVVATMLYPNDETRREQFIAYTVERALIEDGVAVPLDISAKTHFGPSEHEFTRDAVRALNSGGRVAGQILVLLRQLSTHKPKDASVRKAVYLLSLSHLEYERAGYAVPSSEKSIRNAWAQFKSVCNLWAAWRIFEFNVAMTTNERLLELLAVSEWMREFAESHHPPPRTAVTKPLAANGELWKVPDLLNLPPIEFEVPPLSGNELRQLANYKAEKHVPR